MYGYSDYSAVAAADPMWRYDDRAESEAYSEAQELINAHFTDYRAQWLADGYDDDEREIIDVILEMEANKFIREYLTDSGKAYLTAPKLA